MKQRGRKSSAALAVMDDATGSVLPVPAGLTQAERVVWLGLVNSKPRDWFGSQHVPIMVEYCRNVCRAHIIDEQMRAFDAELLETDEGLKRYEKLMNIAAKIGNLIKAFATSMRMTHHSVYLKDKAALAATKSSEKVWRRAA